MHFNRIHPPGPGAALRNTSSHGRRSGGAEELFALGRMENGNEITRRSTVRPLVALAIVAASIGCIAPLPAYAENATAAVVSADGNHVVVDVDLNGDASGVGSAESLADLW